MGQCCLTGSAAASAAEHVCSCPVVQGPDVKMLLPHISATENVLQASCTHAVKDPATHYTAGKIGIERVNCFLSNCVSNGTIDMKLSPDVGNSPSNPHIHRNQSIDGVMCEKEVKYTVKEVKNTLTERLLIVSKKKRLWWWWSFRRLLWGAASHTCWLTCDTPTVSQWWRTPASLLFTSFLSVDFQLGSSHVIDWQIPAAFLSFHAFVYLLFSTCSIPLSIYLTKCNLWTYIRFDAFVDTLWIHGLLPASGDKFTSKALFTEKMFINSYASLYVKATKSLFSYEYCSFHWRNIFI